MQRERHRDIYEAMIASSDAPDAHSAHDSVLNPAENTLDLPSAKVSIEEREGHLAGQGTIRPPKPRQAATGQIDWTRIDQW